METEAEKKKRLEEEAAAAAAAAGGKKPDDKPAPFAVFETSEAFQQRLERDTRKKLKEMGLDPDKASEQIAALKQLEVDKAKAAEAEMSAVQKAQAAQAAAEAKMTAAMSDAEDARMRAHIMTVCAQQGIKNTEYATFAITSKLAGMKDTDELDEVEFLKSLVADPTQAAALGVGSAPAKVGATTTDQGAGPESPAKPAGGGAPVVADAFAQNKDAFAAATQAKYGFTVPG